MLAGTNQSNCTNVVSLIMKQAHKDFPKKFQKLPLSDQESIKKMEARLKRFLSEKFNPHLN